MESLRVLRNFKLDGLNENWISSVWDAEFVTCDEPPEDYLEYLESDDARLLLRESRDILNVWITANCCEEATSFTWQDLMILNINVRGLLATLSYIMKNGQRVGINEPSRQACLEATSLYLMLLTVPGSNAFRIYHPNLYRKAIETLKMSENLFYGKNYSSKTDAINSSTDDESSDQDILSSTEKLKLAKELNRIIHDLVTMLKLFRLKEHAESLDITIQILLDITRLEAYVRFHNNNNNSKIDYEVTLLTQNAFIALRELCSNNHGSISLTIRLIAQYILPYLIIHHSNLHSKSATFVHDTAICLLKNLLKIHEKETAQGIVALMHQLMVKCPDRLEGRQKQAAVIIKLLKICNEDIIVTAFRDIILFSHNSKISYRLFAQEIIGRLLTESSLSNDEDLDKDIKMKMRRILVAIVLSRCMDRSPLVRGRAMATLASFSDCNGNTDKAIVSDMFEPSMSNKAVPTLDDLMRALSEDANPLPGSSTLIAVLLDRVNDERALLRRSALRILKNLSIMFPSLVDKTTSVISDRCRDRTLMVRQYAVHILSEILERFPQNASLLDEWTQAVMPQIYDIESKVQEKVLECLEGVLLNRITNASAYTPDAESSLPWRVLDKLSDMRMRKHLSKACSLWVKNSVVTKSMIFNLQSHIGTENTVGVWILLAALAENMTIPNIDKYIANYKEVIQKNDFHASLVLHVLRHTWSALDRECLEDLHRHLYECIRDFKININLIGICLDILSSILRHLHADESNDFIKLDMVKLIRLSEKEIRDILKKSKSCTLETVEMRAIFTLGHASLLCTSRISSSTLRTLSKLLLQWESLPEAVRKVRNLQATAVVLLCQQALRDREVAKKITPIFGKLMRQETTSNSLMRTAVKINTAKALADICVRFTALVEPYLPDMCMSMKDANPAVREAIVVIFIQLLLEDFIKVKGPFFFHILTMLSDADSMIRELTIFLVEERLLVQNKTLISQQFLESIYHYNNYQSSGFCGHRMEDREKKLLTLPGRANQDKRNIIYDFMLEHLEPSAKLKLVVKLTKYILREVCDGDSLDVTTEEGACVLRDTLFVMSNNRLQLSSINERHKDDTAELDETVNTSSATNNNAMNIIIAGMKKHNLDNLLPTLITLKKKLATLNSSLEDDVERLLFKNYSEYEKEHLLNLLNEYPELERDMDLYQRRLKDKTTLKIDEGRGSSTSLVTNHKDSMPNERKRMKIPQVVLHRLSSLVISSYKSNKLDLNDDSRAVMSRNALILSSSICTDKLSPIESSSGPSFSTSTPMSFLKLKLNSSNVSSIHTLTKHKKRSSDGGIPSNGSRCKALKTS